MALKSLAGIAISASVIALTTMAAHAEELTVYWNAGHSFATYAGVIKQFETDHPGWTVNWQRFQWPDLRTKLVADFAVGNPPDLVEEPGGWVQEFGQQGLITSLNDDIAKDGKAMGYPDDWQAYTVKRNMVGDQYYGVQVHLTCATLVYNVDLLKAAGFDKPPTNWEEFRKVAAATAKGGKFGFAPNPNYDYYWPWLFQAGAHYYDPKTNKVTFDSPDAIRAVQFLSDLVHKDRSAPVPVAGADYEGPGKLFTAGSRTFALTPALHLPIFNGGALKANYGVSKAQLDAAIAQYDSTVLAAAREVATQALGAQQIAARRTVQRTRVEAQGQLLANAQARATQGVRDARESLGAKAQWLQQRDSAVQLQAQAVATDLALVKALGGGYRDASTADRNADSTSSVTAGARP